MSSPSPSSAPDNSSSFKNSSNLYLVTFLATLFLLLFVSCAIVLRSFFLRRRYQQRLDEAYAAGIMLAPQAQGSRRHRYGHRPKLYTSWVTAEGGQKWRDMMPVSALPVQAKRRHRSKHHQQPPSPPSSIWRLLSPPPVTTPVKSEPEKPSRLQVSVLIAMPSPNKPLSTRSSIDKDFDDDSVPNIVFGVTRIPYRHTTRQ